MSTTFFCGGEFFVVDGSTRLFKTKDIFRFLKYLKPGAPEECWPWLGCKTRGGYGGFRAGRRSKDFMGAHRYAYLLAKGPIPEDQVVRHTCHNPVCCNPKHLMLGTHQDNVDDKMRAGRHKAPKGTEVWSAKLTEDQVLEIRRLAAESKTSQVEIGRQFGITGKAVSLIHLGQRWKCL